MSAILSQPPLAAATHPAADRYAAFLNGVFPDRLRERPLLEVLPSELELQSLWFSGAFGRCFRSTDGRLVEIRQFGHWNHAAGPDFSRAAVAVDGTIRRGAIELDTDVRDWEHHGHHINADYDRVVLHLFFDAPDGRRHFTRTTAHREIPQVRLSLAEAAEEAPRPPYEAEAHLGRCAHPLEALSRERIESLLLAAARYRLDRKAARLRRLEEAHGRDQALFQAIAEALGYRPNTFAMRVLAQRLPLRELRQLPALEREALLFGAAGFLETPETAHPGDDTREYLAGLWQHWWQRRAELGPVDPNRTPNWKITGVRPVNHPHRRIAALAALVGAWPKASQLFRAPGASPARAFYDICNSLDHPHWRNHYTLRADRAGRPLALLGRSRATEILANQVFPLLVAKDDACWDAYAGLPAALQNARVRRASLRLFGDHPDRKSFMHRVYQQQALLQIYTDFCLEDDSDCAGCPFPEQLGQWR